MVIKFFYAAYHNGAPPYDPEWYYILYKTNAESIMIEDGPTRSKVNRACIVTCQIGTGVQIVAVSITKSNNACVGYCHIVIYNIAHCKHI